MRKITFENDEVIPIKIIKPIVSDDLIEITLDKKVFQNKESPVEVYSPELSMWYGDTADLNFKIENLFSELTDEYLRTLARINLGIAEQYALVWGNITGNIMHQADLVAFVKETITLETLDFIDQLIEQLKLWNQEINAKLQTKANIYSPTLEGIPKTTTPTLFSYSTQIANTTWVTDKINEALDNSISYFTLSPEWGYSTEKPATVIVTWDYQTNITLLKLNGEVLTNDIRSKSFIISSNTDFVLECVTIDNKISKKTISFVFKDPIYYGTSLNAMELTTNTSFYIDCGNTEYAYVMMPNTNILLSVNNLIGGFELVEIKVIENINYFVYKSYNKGLGNINIVINYG